MDQSAPQSRTPWTESDTLGVPKGIWLLSLTILGALGYLFLEVQAATSQLTQIQAANLQTADKFLDLEKDIEQKQASLRELFELKLELQALRAQAQRATRVER
jgi:hypothetical protein